MMPVDDRHDAELAPAANIDAEQALLGALLCNNAVADEVGNLLPHHFAQPVHQDIYQTAIEEIASGRNVSPVTLKSRFADDPRLADVGGVQYLLQLVRATRSVISTPHYAALVIGAWQRRHAVLLAREILDSAADGAIDTKDIIAGAQAGLERLDEGLSGSQFITIGEAAQRALQRIEAARNGEIVWRTSGLSSLDKILGGGLRDGNLILLAARPAMGKTALALSIAYHCAQIRQVRPDDKAGCPVAFFSLEMTDEQLGGRGIAQASGIDNTALFDGSIDDDKLSIVKSASEPLMKMPILIDPQSGLTVRQVRSRARLMKRRHDIGLIIVDYIGKMAPEDRRANKVDQIEEIVSGLRDVAKELNVPVLALSQLNREVEHRDDKRPQLSDLRSSGALEQESDAVLMLYRDAYYEAKREPSDKVEWATWKADYEAIKTHADLFIRKNRHGQEGVVRLSFDAGHMTFTERDNRHEQAGMEL